MNVAAVLAVVVHVGLHPSTIVAVHGRSDLAHIGPVDGTGWHERQAATTWPSSRSGAIDFYPSALEKGVRSERALKLAVAEMDVQGVSTRKVAAINEKLCGPEVTSSQVTRAAALDDESEKWRDRPWPRRPT